MLVLHVLALVLQDLRLVLYALYPSLSRPMPYLSLRGSAQHLHDEREARAFGCGWAGCDRWGIKSVHQFSLFLVGIWIMYVSTYIFNNKLSPTFWWVKILCQVGQLGFDFQNYPVHVFLNNHAKSIGFQPIICSRNLRFWYFSFGLILKSISYLKSFCG